MQKRTGVFMIVMAISGLTACSGVPLLFNKNHAPIVEGTSVSDADLIVSTAYTRNRKGIEIVSIAEDYLGTPYRYGGDGPSGFDCSGLVQYTHMNVGIDVPRTADDQYKVARKVPVSNLRPGDVIFFRQNIFRKISHVGIYTGNGQFIHAPKAGVPVSFSSLDEPYWEKRLVKAGRFY